MYSKLEIEQYDKAIVEIQTLTRIYEEAALLKINQIRQYITRINQFLTSLAEVYNQAEEDFRLKNLKKKKGKGQQKVMKNGKTALVLIASQKQAYGNLIFNIYKEFIVDVKSTRSDAIVIGAVGKKLIEKENLTSPFVCFDLDDDNPSLEQMKQIVTALCEYEQVVVYFAEFVSILNQLPKKSTLSAGALTVTSGDLSRKFLYEPKIDEAVEFAERETISARFAEKLYLSQIARVGAKIKIVEIGQVALKISEVIQGIDKGIVRVRKRISNKKQMEIFCGYNLWGQR